MMAAASSADPEAASGPQDPAAAPTAELEDLSLQDRPESERSRGTVKWFSSSKGFGFIKLLDSEEEVFVHQSNIDTTGFRSLKEGEEVEFDLVVGEDGKKKAFHVTGPGGAPPQGSTPLRAGYGGGRGGGGYDPAELGYAPAPGSPYVPYGMSGRGRGGGPGAFWGPEAYGLPPGYPYPLPMPPTPAAAAGAVAAAAGAYGYGQPLYPRGRGGFFPGGRNWAGARPPPPGQPGFSSGLQVVVHNLPWDCTWQQLKDAFSACGEIERADVVFDSRGRSRGFGIVRFASKELADKAVEEMNNQVIGGRVVSVRIDRFA
eukprot:scaffold19.g1776.t1